MSEVREWISVRDKLPEHMTEVLCLCFGWMDVFGYTEEKGFFTLDEKLNVISMNREVTYWMPLPEKPNEI